MLDLVGHWTSFASECRADLWESVRSHTSECCTSTLNIHSALILAHTDSCIARVNATSPSLPHQSMYGTHRASATHSSSRRQSFGQLVLPVTLSSLSLRRRSQLTTVSAASDSSIAFGHLSSPTSSHLSLHLKVSSWSRLSRHRKDTAAPPLLHRSARTGRASMPPKRRPPPKAKVPPKEKARPKPPTQSVPSDIWHLILPYLRNPTPAPLSRPPRSQMCQPDLCSASLTCRVSLTWATASPS